MISLRKKIRKFCENSFLYKVSLLKRDTVNLSLACKDVWPAQPFLTDINNVSVLFLKDNKNPLLNSFEWLRNFKNSESATVKQHICQIIELWIKQNSGLLKKPWATVAWDADVMGYRLYNWISIFHIYSDHAKPKQKLKLLKSLNRQFSQLNRCWNDAKDPLKKLRALKGIFAYLSISKREKIRKWVKILDKIINEQTLPDGGHISRNPLIQLYFLRDLIDIRNIIEPYCDDISELKKRISTFASIVRMLRHGNGMMAEFNNEQKDPFIPNHVSSAFIDACLSLSDVERRPPTDAKDIGYLRSVNKTGILLFNKKADKAENLFNFEWSYDRQVIIKKTKIILEDNRFIDFNEKYVSTNKDISDQYTLLENEFNHKDYYFKRNIFLSNIETNIRGEDILKVPYSTSLCIQFELSPDIEVLPSSKTMKSFTLKLSALNVNSLKKFTRITTLQFVTTGCYDLLYKPKTKTENHSIVLLGYLETNKQNTIKWAFALNH